MPPSGVTCSAPSSRSSCARSWTSAAARRACGLSGATCCATSTVCSTPPSRAPARHGPCAHRLMAVPPPSCRPPASLCHPGSRRPRHRKPAPNRPPHPSAAAGRGVVPRAPEFPKFRHPVRYLALSGVQVESGSFGSRLFEDGERLVAMFGDVLLALDRTVPPASMDGEGGVSQGGEGLGGVAGSGAAGVLAAGPIADVVQAVLDSPMPSRDVEQ